MIDKIITYGFTIEEAEKGWIVYYPPGSTELPIIGEKPNRYIATAILRSLIELGENALNLALEEIVDIWGEADDACRS